MKSENQPTPSSGGPTVLVFAGLDPTGGAGLAADIEAIASMGAHALPVATCLTVQDTQNVSEVVAVDSLLIEKQLSTLADDLPITVIKIGLLAELAVIDVIQNFLHANKTIPVVFDPILRAGGGESLADDTQLAAMQSLLADTFIATPNVHEARTLTGENTLEDCASKMLATGCQHVLITGTDNSKENAANVQHVYFNQAGERETYEWPKLLGSFHGSGCTLSSALAGLLSHGLDIKDALDEAQQYTWDTLANALQLSKQGGQAIPQRFYWSHDT